jgi:hypothetical protein
LQSYFLIFTLYQYKTEMEIKYSRFILSTFLMFCIPIATLKTSKRARKHNYVWNRKIFSFLKLIIHLQASEGFVMLCSQNCAEFYAFPSFNFVFANLLLVDFLQCTCHKRLLEHFSGWHRWLSVSILRSLLQGLWRESQKWFSKLESNFIKANKTLI